MTMHVPLILLKESHRFTMNPSLPFFFKERPVGNLGISEYCYYYYFYHYYFHELLKK